MDELTTTRRARRELARTAKRARKESNRAAKRAKAVGAEFADTAAGATADVVATMSRKAAKAAAKAEQRATKLAKKSKPAKSAKGKGRGRRWPWFLAVGAVAAGTVFVVRAKRSGGDQQSATVSQLNPDRAASNGTVPTQQERTGENAEQDQGGVRHQP